MKTTALQAISFGFLLITTLCDGLQDDIKDLGLRYMYRSNIKSTNIVCPRYCECYPKQLKISCTAWIDDIKNIPRWTKHIQFESQQLTFDYQFFMKLHQLFQRSSPDDKLTGILMKIQDMTAHKKNKQSRAMPSLYKDTTSLKDIIKRSLRLSNDNNWSVKLSGGKDKSSGYIVIDSKNHTFGVCSKNWAMSNDDVICRQMGFDGAARQLGNERPASKMKLNGWTMRMHCYGYESRLQLCQVSKSNLFMNSIPCPDNSYVFVQCQKPCATSDPYGSPTICSTFECGLCNWKSTILHGNIGWNWFPKQESHRYRYSPLSANSLVAPPFAYVVRPPEYDQQMIAKLESPLLNLISKPLQIMIHYEVEGNDLSHYQIHAVDEHEHLINFTTVNLHAVSKNQLTKKSVIYPHHSGKVKIAFIVISLAVHKSHQSSAFILHDFIVSGAELNRNRSFMIGIGFVGFAIIFGIIGGVFYCIVSARREAAKAASEDQEKSKESSSGKSPDVELMEMISSESRDVSTV